MNKRGLDCPGPGIWQCFLNKYSLIFLSSHVVSSHVAFNQDGIKNSLFAFPTADSQLWVRNTVFHPRLVESMDTKNQL